MIPPCCSRKFLFLLLSIVTLFILFLSNQMIPFIKPVVLLAGGGGGDVENGGGYSSIFQIKNYIHIGFFYDDYENVNRNSDSMYKTLPNNNNNHTHSNGSTSGSINCNIPNLDPFQLQALKLIADDEHGKEEPKCLSKHSLVKFRVQNGALVRVNASMKYWKTVKCCYEGFGKAINKNATQPCRSIFRTITMIPIKFEFINVKCLAYNGTTREEVLDYQDQFQFFRLRLDHKLQHSSSGTSGSGTETGAHLHPADKTPNIIFLGMDSISHTNFIRLFPKSHQYLTAPEHLNALEFFGRNKISVSTQGNLLAMITGCTLKQNSQNPAFEEETPPLTSCPLVWRQYFKNYTVLRAEDDFGLEHQFFPTLDTGKSKGKTVVAGSTHPTADYNWLDFIGYMKKVNKAKGSQFTYGCFDYQWNQHLLMERILTVAQAFAESNQGPGAAAQPYFHFTWTATATHDLIGYGRYLDEPLYELLQNLHTKSLLNNTILILVSDHGMAYGTYSRTAEGSIESRMPLLYFVFPPWFKAKYSQAIENMRLNTLRLTTPWDLYETLIDLSNLNHLHRVQLKQPRKHRSTPPALKGLSLFRPVPANRTCESAGIPEEWCICWTKSIILSPGTNSDLVQSVQIALAELNKKFSSFPKCSQLKIIGIETGRLLSSKLFDNKHAYEIIFKTSPGAGLFEVSVAKQVLSTKTEFRILGDIVRVNAYGQRGPCLAEYEKKKLIVPYLVNSACYCS